MLRDPLDVLYIVCYHDVDLDRVRKTDTENPKTQLNEDSDIFSPLNSIQASLF